MRSRSPMSIICSRSRRDRSISNAKAAWAPNASAKTRAVVSKPRAPLGRTNTSAAVAEPPTMTGIPKVGPSGRFSGTSTPECSLRLETSMASLRFMTSSANDCPGKRLAPSISVASPTPATMYIPPAFLAQMTVTGAPTSSLARWQIRVNDSSSEAPESRESLISAAVAC